jgi:pyroglutamyl-peptidase
MKLFLTGFGSFEGVDDNPSRRVAKIVHKQLKSKGVDSEFRDLTVSTSAVDSFYESLVEGERIFVLHVGVDACSQGMKIESVARNMLKLRPERLDAEGASRVQKQIDLSFPLDDKLHNPLNTACLHLELRDRFGISKNAGTYICNYAYFRGLQEIGRKICGCLFVHVPLFGVIELEKQVENLSCLAEKILSLEEFQ